MGPFAVLALLGMGIGMAALVSSDDDPDETSQEGEELAFDGSETLLGTAGDDTLAGEQDIDLSPTSIELGAGDDVVNLELTTAFFEGDILGGAGDDSINFGTIEASLIDGGDGNDTISGVGLGSTTITGGLGDDIITSSSGFSSPVTVDGGDGNDTLTVTDLSEGGYNNNAYVSGGAGNDVLIYGGNFDGGAGYVISGDGGTGDDTFQVTVSAATERYSGADGGFATGGAGSDQFELTIVQTGEEFDTLYQDASLAIEEENVFNIRDFEPGIDSLQIDASADIFGFSMTEAQLDTSDPDDAKLVLLYETENSDVTRVATVSLGAASNIQWSDIEFIGGNIPTLTPLV